MKAIMYHYVRPDDPNLPYFRHLHIDDFEAQLNYFKTNFGLIDYDTFESCIFEKKELPDGVLLTFDDGLKDHHDYVLPMLKKFNTFGIFYIPTAPYSSKKILDVHRTHILIGTFPSQDILETLKTLISEEMLIPKNKEEFDHTVYKTQENIESTLLIKKILNYFLDYAYRSQILDKLFTVYNLEESKLINDFYLSKKEIQTLHNHNMIIGSHTENHPVMSRLDAKQQENELNSSFNILTPLIPTQKLKTFCYPYGGFHSFNTHTTDLLDQHNCHFSFNVEPRDITLDDITNSPQTLPRYDCNLFEHGQCRES